MEHVDWPYVAQYRDKLRAVVKTAMKLQVP